MFLRHKRNYKLKEILEGKFFKKLQISSEEQEDSQQKKQLSSRCLAAPLSRRKLPVNKKSKLHAKTKSNDGAPSTLVNIFVNLQKVPGGGKTHPAFYFSRW